jgi:pyruvate dehydrogenase E1 component
MPDARPYATLGTDGFGRSDSHEQLRSFFKVDAAHIVVATLNLLADEGEVDSRLVKDAISSLGLDVDASPAWYPQPQIDHSPDAPAVLGANPKPVPHLVEEDDAAISDEGKAEDAADAPILNQKPE